jgi:hypothetical protein
MLLDKEQLLSEVMLKTQKLYSRSEELSYTLTFFYGCCEY